MKFKKEGWLRDAIATPRGFANAKGEIIKGVKLSPREIVEFNGWEDLIPEDCKPEVAVEEVVAVEVVEKDCTACDCESCDGVDCDCDCHSKKTKKKKAWFK